MSLRNPFRPAPPPETLGQMEVHELLRDFPELLPVLASRGIGGRERGTETLEPSLLSGERSGEEVTTHLRWRTPNGG